MSDQITKQKSDSNTVSSPYPSNVRTSILEKVSYGMGDVACNVVFALTSGLVVYFYTNVMSISAELVGTIMLFSRFFDGFSDLAIGFIMDRVNSRFGKGRAWVLWMTFPYAISAVLLFCLPPNAPQAVQAIYIFITYNLCTTVVYTALNLPYAAMAPLMTSNENDLSKINLFRMAMSPIGNMIVTAATLPIINRMGGNQSAWIKVTLIYSIIAIVLLLWCFFGTKERVHLQATNDAEKMPILKKLKVLLSNKYFLIMLFTSMFLAIYQTINGTVGTYYSQYILGNNELYGTLNLFENIPQVIVIMILAPFIQKFGKRNLVLAGAITIVVAQSTLLFVPPSIPYLCAIAVIRGIAKAPLFGCVFTMLADVVNYGHWKTGIRIQAIIFAAVTVGQKFGGGITGWIIGKLMKMSGFKGLVEEIPSAVNMVNSLYIWGAVISWAVVVTLMLCYRLEKHYDEMIDDMRAKNMLTQSKEA
jgi:GPH family glycoside/pentoside/hexuronide:cation symporter